MKVGINGMGRMGRLALRAALGGVIVSSLCEWGQTIFAGQTPCITDVILGGIGMGIGCGIRQRVETG